MSGTGPRFTWETNSDLIMLLGLLGEVKPGAAAFEAASAKLAAQGFVSSDGNPVNARAISQHYGKLRDRVSKIVAEGTTGDGSLPSGSAATGAGGSASSGDSCIIVDGPTPITPAKRTRGRAKKTDAEKAAEKAAKANKAAAKKAATPTKTRGGRGKLGVAKPIESLSEEKVRDDDEDEDDEDEMMETPAKKRRVSKVELVGSHSANEDEGEADMEISDESL